MRKSASIYGYRHFIIKVHNLSYPQHAERRYQQRMYMLYYRYTKDSESRKATMDNAKLCDVYNYTKDCFSNHSFGNDLLLSKNVLF